MQSPAKELYHIFKPYKVDAQEFFAESCGCCMTLQECEDLAATPLDKLSVQNLDRYAANAISTWGNAQQFKHFLPRLLELTLDQYERFNMPEVLLGKLALADWKTWPEFEQDAIRNFLMSFWKHQLTRPGNLPVSDPLDIETVIGGLAQACDSIQPYLDAWPAVADPNALLHLAQFISDHTDEILTTSRVCLWGKPQLASSEIIQWLPEDVVRDYLSPHHQELEHRFPFVLHQLEALRTAHLES